MPNVMCDTSCALAAVMPDLLFEVAEQLPLGDRQCTFLTSLYLRMEFMRRWILTGIRIYIAARRRGSLSWAISWASEEMGSREPKAVAKWAAEYDRVKSRAKLGEAERCEQFGKLVLRCARDYDLLFRMVNPSKTKCRRGQLAFDYSARSTREALRDFYQRFSAEDHACGLAELLSPEHRCPKARPVVDANPTDVPSNARRAFKALHVKLNELFSTCRVPSCGSCSALGDLLIALEQPRRTTLYTVDHLFDALCPLLGKPHKRLASIRAVARKKDILSDLLGD